MENIKNYTGVIMIIVAALVLTLSYFCGWQDINVVNIGSLVLIIAGIVTHVLINKRNE